MTEWKLFEGDAPDFSAPKFFREHPWVAPARQAGHAERTEMAARVIRDVVTEYSPASVSDLGCGDGSLMELIRHLPVRLWGYDAGLENLTVARAKGLDAREADLLASGLEYGDLITCCEVAEHLADPHGFIKALPGRLLVLTSPSSETGDWHYEHHAWAWDQDGYASLVTGAGWKVVTHTECDGGTADHMGKTAPMRFQAIFAMRK